MECRLLLHINKDENVHWNDIEKRERKNDNRRDIEREGEIIEIGRLKG